MIALVARETFTFDGVTRAKGEHFSVPPVVAAALTRQRKAVFPQQYQSDDRTTEPRPRRRRAYRRKDMVAESA